MKNLLKREKKTSKKLQISQLNDLLENARLEIQMLSDVNKSLKNFLIYGLKSEENLASLNSHFDQIANALIQDAPDESTPSGQADPKEEILARILSLEIEIDKIHQENNQVINQSNINEVIDQMNDRNAKLEARVDEASEQIENFRTCQICFENYDYQDRHRSILAQCGHVLCHHCAQTMLVNCSKATCPTCRKPFSNEHVIKIFEATLS